MERTKIGIFMEFYLPYLGGIERYIDRLSAQLRHLGYDVFIVTSLFDESLPRFEERDGMRVYRLPTKGLFKQRYPFFKRDARFKETMARVEAEAADFYIVNTRFHLTAALPHRGVGRVVQRRQPRRRRQGRRPLRGPVAPLRRSRGRRSLRRRRH